MLKIIIKTKNTPKSRILDLFTFAIVFFISYLIVMPIYPLLASQFDNRSIKENIENNISNTLISVNSNQSHFPVHQDKLLENLDNNQVALMNYDLTNDLINEFNNKTEIKTELRGEKELIIQKIGVKAPIIETNNEKEGLDRGAWLYPGSAKPNEIGNTVISAHRYKYLPPHNVTFYSLDKLILGDEIIVNWDGQTNIYLVKEIKVVEDNDKSVILDSDESIITLITCHPIFTTEKRLVIIGERIK